MNLHCSEAVAHDAVIYIHRARDRRRVMIQRTRETTTLGCRGSSPAGCVGIPQEQVRRMRCDSTDDATLRMQGTQDTTSTGDATIEVDCCVVLDAQRINTAVVLLHDSSQSAKRYDKP